MLHVNILIYQAHGHHSVLWGNVNLQVIFDENKGNVKVDGRNVTVFGHEANMKNTIPHRTQ